MKKFFKEIYPYIIIVVVVVLLRLFIVTPVRVDGNSMESTLHNWDILILNKLNKDYERFDIVVINNGDSKLIKRIIGMPGENIEYKDNELYINGKKVKDVAIARTANFTLEGLYKIKKIPENYYFVMGDNRGYSKDSRSEEIGLINKKDIVGTTSIRIFPFNKIGKFN